MDIRKLQRAIVDGLEDVKGQNIVVFNTEHLSALFERVIIASGTSNRQTKALAASVRDAVKEHGLPAPRTEGEANGEWIIVDCGAAVVHVMQPTIRDYYHLEEIWGDKPVRMKVDNAPVRLVKAEEPESKSAAKKAAGKRAPTKTAAAKAPAKKAATKRAPASKTTARKAPAVKTAAAKSTVRKIVIAKKAAAGPRSGVTRTVGVKSAAAKSAAPAKSASARKVPARKTPARKAPARKTATRSA